ncbi:hypothetical protein TCAL_13658 [Tigriopus californicus]|uniref:Uncharacterized protein n=1 Tax=Tigriopus californicus TaxID=6832 RepID=A0A553PSI9_TIGCA|nr:hypothetical protein TCAL_13658 [Tigriopus californicus]|eukprot:TCALIF_13658-PA protein Name:"Protein of unknown function" AED:0.10 eAED:0.18 QI:0/0/0/1/1/1/2/0/212
MVKAVDAVSIKLPIFWETNPKSWFTLVKAQFSLQPLNSPNSTTLFKQTTGVCTNQYSELKGVLLEVFGKSEAQLYRELFEIAGLGDQRSTALLRHMQALVDPKDQKSKLLRAFLLSRLPPTIQQALGRNPPPDIMDLAKAADEVLEASDHSSTFIQPVLRGNHSRTSGVKSKPLRCWYHASYGLKARKCLHTTLTLCDMSNAPSAGNVSADN